MSAAADLVHPGSLDAKELLAGILRWVEIETPSHRPGQIGRLLDMIAADFAGLPVTLERIAGRDGLGDHLIARYAPAGASGKSAFLTGHIDTVWEVGTTARRPPRVEGDRAHGPGIYDMKAGSYLGFDAVRRLAAARVPVDRPIVALFNSDEEIGSPTSRDIIERLAADAAFVLVPEPAIGPGVACVTSRKGWGRFKMKFHGRSAHAGGDHASGRSAIREMAHQIIALEGMTDYSTGTTVNVGVARGGTLLNVVPAAAEIEIDVRVADETQAERIAAILLSSASKERDIGLEVEGGWNRLPFRRSKGVEDLYHVAAGMAQSLGFALPETMRGGVSDGNFTAAMGRPTLDGLGCGGDGAHAEHEHILVSSIANRAALICNLLAYARVDS